MILVAIISAVIGLFAGIVVGMHAIPDTEYEKGSDMKITLTRAEGPSHLCGKPHIASSFAEAQRILWNMSATGPRVGYDKVDFRIENAETDFEYDGRYDLTHFSVWPPNLQKHCIGFLRFMGGADKPLSMREDMYQRFLDDRVPDLARRQEYLAAANWLEKQP